MQKTENKMTNNQGSDIADNVESNEKREDTREILDIKLIENSVNCFWINNKK